MRFVPFILCGVLTACGESASDSRLRGEVERIRTATVASGGSLGEFSGLQRTEHKVECSWTVTGGVEWAAFKADLTKRLGASYHVQTSTESELGLGWMGDGDAYVVMIRKVADKTPTTLRVTFTAAAS